MEKIDEVLTKVKNSNSNEYTNLKLPTTEILYNPRMNVGCQLSSFLPWDQVDTNQVTTNAVLSIVASFFHFSVFTYRKDKHFIEFFQKNFITNENQQFWCF